MVWDHEEVAPMNWYLTWQDGVALVVALAGLGLAWWLHRRFSRPGGCAKCPMLQEPARPADSVERQGPGTTG